MWVSLGLLSVFIHIWYVEKPYPVYTGTVIGWLIAIALGGVSMLYWFVFYLYWFIQSDRLLFIIGKGNLAAPGPVIGSFTGRERDIE